MGRTMLHYLVQSDSTGKVTNWFIKKYGETANIDVQTKNGVTALMLAVKAGNDEVVKALLHGIANPFFKDQLGNEAIDYHIRTEEN